MDDPVGVERAAFGAVVGVVLGGPQQRGVQGGVRLARTLEDITIADVIEAMEGPLALNVCLSPGYQCENMKTCQVRKVLAAAQSAMLQELRKKSLAEIVAAGKEAEL